MGRLIDTSDLHNKVMLNKSDWGIFATQIDNLIEGVVMQVSTAEAIPKADYEARLKADMVTMLEELKKEIIELPFPQKEPEYMQGYSYCQMNILDYVIQEKINKLKGERVG